MVKLEANELINKKANFIGQIGLIKLELLYVNDGQLISLDSDVT